jgi:hypothetical protein
MNTSLRTSSIENRQDSQYLLSDSVNLNTETDWIQYLSKSATSIKDLSSSQQMRFHLASYINDFKNQSNRHLFHLTLTYKPFEDYSYSPKNTNDFFIHFYTKHFLPFLLNTKNVQRSKYREFQPICLAFLDEHESRVSSQTYLQSNRFSARLHHHAILAIHADTYDKMQSLIGENTLASNKFSTKVMSSHVRECDAMCLLYASKMYAKYPDFLSFPDRLQ